jgi:single-stranded-DNA-specific exonuclease
LEMNFFPKKWLLKKSDPGLIDEISGKLGVGHIVSRLLVNRGIVSVKDAYAFMNPSLLDMENPFCLSDMTRAVERARHALDGNERILIYGDRDVDGVTAVCVVYNTLKSLGAAPAWYIPTEIGYGLHKSIIEQNTGKIDLIITVDCGITAHEEVLYARERGMDVIITDHHELPPDSGGPDGLPKAAAVVNPKRKDNLFSFSDLAGCSVALKFAQALMMSYDEDYGRETVALEIGTTGPHPLCDRIREIAAIRSANFVPLEYFHAEAVSGEKYDGEIKRALEGLMEFIGGRTIAVNNAEFTVNFLRAALKKHLNCGLDNRVTDILALSRGAFPFRSYSLNSLLETLGLAHSGTVGASSGARAVLEAYERLKFLGNGRINYFLQDNLDLVTLGTVGDMVPLVKENRIIVKHGLESLRNTRKLGLKLLLERVLRGNGPITSKEVSFNIAPLLNACGRLSKVDVAVELLISDNDYRAQEALRKMVELNDERRLLQSTNIEKFGRLVPEQCDMEKDSAIFVTAEKLGHGVTGIVASQLARKYNRPVLLLIIEGDTATGAGRSVSGFNLYDAVKQCSDILVKYGGHAQAIGLTVRTPDIEKLRSRFKEIVNRDLSPESLAQKIEIDTELNLADIGPGLMSDLSKLEPYGLSNPLPTFMFRNVKIDKYSRMGSGGEHLKLKCHNPDSADFETVGWGLGNACDTILKETDFIDLAGNLELSNWRERNFIQLSVTDIRYIESGGINEAFS